MTGIRFRFVTSDRSAVSKMIQAAEYGFWASHVEAVMPEGTYLGAHFEGGVLNRPIYYDADEWTRQQFVDLVATDQQRDRFHDFLRKQVGAPYDATAIAAFLAPGRDWSHPGSWFCSELAGAGLIDCGYFSTTLSVAVDHLTPRDLNLALSARPDAVLHPIITRSLP